MLRNYFKIAIRNIWKHRGFSLINILGLSLGLSSALLIIFHVREELNFDKGYAHADRIFRVVRQGKGEDSRAWAATGFPLGQALQESLPEVEKIARFNRPYPYQLLSYTGKAGKEKRFQEKGGLFADPAALQIFGYEFLEGDSSRALSDPGTIVLTQRMARKYFDGESAVGKLILDERQHVTFKVTGVVADPDFGTHLQFDYLLSMATIDKYNPGALENRNWSGFYTYILLRGKKDLAKVEAKLPAITAAFFKEPGETDAQVLASVGLAFQPISSIHLHSRLEKELSANSDVTYVYIFSIAALLILLLASVNFINLLTAQAFNRIKEIGLRKVVGASRGQLIRQFLGESFLLTLFSALLAVLLFREAIPVYNALTDKNLHFSDLFSGSSLWMLALLICLVSLLAGLYPAWFVSGFNAVSSLKGKKLRQPSVQAVKKGLIVFQFAVSVFMVFSTIVVYRQMKLFHDKDLGFDKEQLVAITMYDEMWEKFGSLIGEMKRNPSIRNYSVTSTLPGERFGMYPFSSVSAAGESTELPAVRVLWADDQLLSTFNISLLEGRGFRDQFPQIRNNEFIMNEAASRLYGSESVLGRKFLLDRDTGTVVGVVRDFNFASLHSTVEPLVIQYNPFKANYLLLNIKPGQLKQTMAYMEAGIKGLYPSGVFTYTFIDEKLDQLYSSENRMSSLTRIFACLAMLISAMGLLGISTYSIRLRTGEIGIRKTLGASVPGVVFLLSRDFVRLVFVAIIVAWPIAWWATNKWLSTFAYRISIDWKVFLFSGGFALLTGAAIVSFRAFRTALVNPVRSLKSE